MGVKGKVQEWCRYVRMGWKCGKEGQSDWIFQQHAESFEFRIFGLSLLQDRDVGVGVFPQR